MDKNKSIKAKDMNALAVMSPNVAERLMRDKEGIKPTSTYPHSVPQRNEEIKEKVLKEIEENHIKGEYWQGYNVSVAIDKAIDLTIQEKDTEFEKEKGKWIEERGRMSKLLFKKGVKNW